MSEPIDIAAIDAAKPDDYHLQSMRCALVYEAHGGMKAEDNLLMERAVSALMTRGMTEDQIMQAYRARFPR
jgi:hypothetical protein